MKKIILIDDDAGLREVFELILRREGFEVVSLADGEPILEGKFDVPALFLIDKQLPGVDGLDICRHLKGRQDIRRVPVIIFSASPLAEKPAREAGADDFLEKPVKMSHLLDIIRKHTNVQKA